MFGVVGVIIGPIIAALFVTVWEIYGKAFKDVLPNVAGTASEKKGQSNHKDFQGAAKPTGKDEATPPEE